MIATWTVFAITILTIFAYAQGKLRIETISITLITLLIVTFHVLGYSKPKLLSAFSNPALITVISMLIISYAIITNNSFNIISQLILHKYNNYPSATIIGLLIVSFLFSLCVNNTPIVAIFIPLMSLVTKKFNIASSKLMIPLAFTASLSGLITVIASSTNLLIHAKLSELGYKISIFDFILPGSIIASISLIYTIFVLPKILPNINPISKQLLTDKFIVKIIIPDKSEFIGKKVSDITTNDVIALQRNNNCYYKFQNKELSVNDVIFLSTTREELTDLLNNKAGLIIKNSVYTNKTGKIKEDLVLRELMVAPNSYITGKKLDSIEYYSSSKVFALGIQRSSQLLRTNLHTITLKGGDRILLIGDQESINEFTTNYQLISTDTDSLHIPKHTKASLVNLIFISVIVITACKMLPIMVSSILGVSALLITKCISVKQIKESFDIKIFLVITSTYMLSTALQETGGLVYILHLINNISQDFSPLLIVSFIFIIITILNEVMSNNAVGLIFAPIVMGIASSTDANPRLFIWGLFFASNCAFATPIAYQTNLLVMGPGNYKFTDYYKVGIPLTLLIYFSYIIFAYFYFS